MINSPVPAPHGVRRLARLAAFLLTATLFVTGCQSWVVIKQAHPNPLVGKSAFALEPLHFETMSVGGKPEAAYLAEKEEKSQKSWEVDKADAARLFADKLRAGARGVTFTDPAAAGAQLLVRGLVTFWEPGSYTVVYNLPSELRITLLIVDDKGTVLDEVAFHQQVRATMTSPSSGDRMRTAAEILGGEAARYLNTRTAAGK